MSRSLPAGGGGPGGGIAGSGDGAACGVSETGYAQVHHAAVLCGDLVHLGELASGRGDADLQAFGLAVPALSGGFVDAGAEVGFDLDQAGSLGGVGAQQRTADAAVLVDARGGVGASAGSQRQLAAFEVAEELIPFFLGGGAVLPGGTQRPAAGDERPVAVDHFAGVDGLVAHGGADVAVPGHELGDVRRHPVHDRVGDEDPAEVVGGEPQRTAVAAGRPAALHGDVDEQADGRRGDRAVPV